MELQDYVKIVRNHWKLVVVSVLLLLGLAGAYILTATPVYSASAELFVADSNASTPQELVEASDFTLDRVKSYVYVVDSEIVLEPVIEELDLDLTTSELAGKVSATVPTDTVVIQIRVSDTSPELAQQIANAIADQFRDISSTLDGQAATSSTITVLGRAEEPTQPIAPNRKLVIGFGLMLGIAAGLTAAVVRERWDNRIRREDDVRAITALPIIGRIPKEEQSAPFRPVIDGNALHGMRAEAFRQLRTNLQFLDLEHDMEALVVTSSLPGEGKTTVAINLALALTDAGTSVCLVDADLRQPQVASYLDLESGIGLTDVLIGSVEHPEAIQPWGRTGLDIITSGHLPPNPSELLGTSRMDALIDTLHKEYDLVIIDTPPLLAVSDASAVARHGPSVLVVTRAGTKGAVRRPQLGRTLDDLHTSGAKGLGIVMTRLPTKGPDSIPMTAYKAYQVSDR